MLFLIYTYEGIRKYIYIPVYKFIYIYMPVPYPTEGYKLRS